ncbi:MAG: hypothetical protein JHC26_06770 [Thermofilum sp.]|jgi:hypothetical protein|uniref:hypothetical protein n=1 Tax=Thermofilum sp. TaxID=1961369 RepID=UPI00258ABE21|nr:hypothetical protein [Thermofilum sp.]MCI4408777.1 hypothetical protein [Thermofilum sp.]
MRDKKEEEQIERITLETFLIYLTIFVTYLILVRYASLVNHALLDNILTWNYVITLLPIPMFLIAKLFMPRGWWYRQDKRTNFVVYLYMVYALVFLGNWILVYIIHTSNMYPILFGLIFSLVYMFLFIYYGFNQW